MTRYQIPDFNNKLYRSSHGRLDRKVKGTTPHLDGRALLYQNHYGSKRRVRRSRFVIPVLIVIVCIMVLQAIFQASWFRLTDIQIEGVKYAAIDDVRSFINDELKRRRWIVFKNSNYFLFAEHKMRDRLERKFYVDVLELKAYFPNKIVIVIRERISNFVVQTPDGYFTVGTDGKALSDVDRLDEKRLLIADEREVRERSVPVSYLEKATGIANDWDMTVTTVALRSFHLDDDPNRITISTSRGFKVYLSPVKEVHPQLERLSVFLQDRDFQSPEKYVDLRFDELVNVR